ncbi:hypothetical protein D3C73_543580 [compost metagenome]
MPFFEQQQPVGIHLIFRHRRGQHLTVILRHRHEEPVGEQGPDLKRLCFHRQRRDHRIQPPVEKFGNQPVGHCFLQLNLDFQIGLTQMRDQFRHKIGRDRRNDADADRPG